MPHPNHLGSHRKRWRLSEQELANLLGYRFKSAISRAEANERLPTMIFALGCEVVFGQSARNLFPSLYAEVEDAVMRRAKKLDDQLRDDYSHDANVKRELLSTMAKRAGKPNVL